MKIEAGYTKTGVGLNIHDEIERGDNDSIKNAPKGITNARVRCS